MTQDGDLPQGADSIRDAANEEFLFHLYRGAELLQDNRVHEAKEELETALDLQPRDPKGQDLLAGVYFRLGMYPRAIQIYEQLHRDIPSDPALMINLALCYLKTGQAQNARVVLEELVVQIPEHRRAWGYLGLAYERLGDLDKAEQSFERAGHTAMAKRVASLRAQQPQPQAVTVLPEATRVEDAAIRATAAVAFQELDSGELSFALAEPAMRRTESGTWRAIELGAAVRAPSVPPPAPQGPTQAAGAATATRAPRALSELIAGTLLGATEGQRFRLHSSGVLVVHAPQGFAARLEALRAHTGGLETSVLERQTRTPSPEPFGGLGSPMLRMKVSGPVLLGPRPAHRLVPIAIDDESSLFLREDMVFAFDLALTFENGRLTFGEGDSMPVAQFRGGASIVLELLDPLLALEVSAGRSVVVRRESLIGWTGRLLPRAVPMSEAPSGQRGLLGFSGEGAVFVAGR